ncbi:MAG: tetratricopeptide repeat protein [Chloroflexi bacterium]|nr:tetratricopeptide repeat protein [Chloroflexota bacterium]
MATDEAGHIARAGLLRMARQWRDTGSTHQAVEAYREILTNYPGTQVATAAVQELTELAEMMENQGQFHSALEVYRMLEQFGIGK